MMDVLVPSDIEFEFLTLAIEMLRTILHYFGGWYAIDISYRSWNEHSHQLEDHGRLLAFKSA